MSHLVLFSVNCLSIQVVCVCIFFSWLLIWILIFSCFLAVHLFTMTLAPIQQNCNTEVNILSLHMGEYKVSSSFCVIDTLWVKTGEWLASSWSLSLGMLGVSSISLLRSTDTRWRMLEVGGTGPTYTASLLFICGEEKELFYTNAA